MIKKNLLKKKSVIIALGLSLCMATMGVSSVCAKRGGQGKASQSGDAVVKEAETKDSLDLDELKKYNGKYQTNIKNVYANYIIEPAKADEEFEKSILNAFGKVIIDVNVPKITYTLELKETSYQDIKVCINNVETIIVDSKTHEYKKVPANVLAKDSKGNPTSISLQFDFEKDIPTGYFLATLTSVEDDAAEIGFGFCMELDEDAIQPYVDDVKTIDDGIVKNKDDAKAIDIVKKAVDKKGSSKLDKSPKTVDSMSTGVVVSVIAGSMSLVALAGVYVLRKKKNNA